MIKNNKFWIIISLINLSIVALLGMVLRSKFLFSVLPFIEYRNVLSAHSHFAFAGWVTLSLAVLLINMLPEVKRNNNKYQVILAGLEITAVGMLLSFPLQGYGPVSIFFSTAFIFFTYFFSGVFISDIIKTDKATAIKILSTGALICLVLSSAGPFTLAYMLASQSGDAVLYRDSLYGYLHFQYNGFFTLSVFAVFFDQVYQRLNHSASRSILQFSVSVLLSIVPALFLSLTWHSDNLFIKFASSVGCLFVLITIIYFLKVMIELKRTVKFANVFTRNLWMLAMISFAIKSLLQMGTIVPDIANAVFGFRPVIIGFLHLVFLGFVTFYILSYWMEKKYFALENKFVKSSLVLFTAAIAANEIVLLIQGIGLMLHVTNPVYPWLLWLISILLFTGAISLALSVVNSIRKKVSIV
ncbi:MAG: hypothetical protein ABI772_03300 [Bacteroidota bacterium]